MNEAFLEATERHLWAFRGVGTDGYKNAIYAIRLVWVHGERTLGFTRLASEIYTGLTAESGECGVRRLKRSIKDVVSDQRNTK